jgi:hypothetical protein
MSSLSNSNLLKPPKKWSDIVLKGKTLSKVIARGSALSLSISTIITQLSIAKIAILSDAFLPLPICVIIFSLLYEIIPDSYSVIKKKILKRKNGEITPFEQSEINEIKMIIDEKVDVLNTSRTHKTNMSEPIVMDEIPQTPINNDVVPQDDEKDEPPLTGRIYSDANGNLFQKYVPPQKRK